MWDTYISSEYRGENGLQASSGFSRAQNPDVIVFTWASSFLLLGLCPLLRILWSWTSRRVIWHILKYKLHPDAGWLLLFQPPSCAGRKWRIWEEIWKENIQNEVSLGGSPTIKVTLSWCWWIRVRLVLDFMRKGSGSSAAELFKYAEQLYFVSAWIIQKLDKFENVISIKRIISREDFEIFCLKQYLVLWKPNCWHIWQLCCWITIPLGGKEEDTMFLQIKLNLITLKTFFRGFYHKQLKYTIASKIAKHMDIGHACMHDHVVSDLSFIYFMLSFKLPKQSWFDV